MSVAPIAPYYDPPTTGGDVDACIGQCQARYPLTCYLPGFLSCSCVDGCREGEAPATGLFGSGYEAQDIAGGVWRYGQEALESVSGAVERAALPVAAIVVGGLVLYLLILRS